MSTYKFCGGTCPQCPPGSAAYASIYTYLMHEYSESLNVSPIMHGLYILYPFLKQKSITLSWGNISSCMDPTIKHIRKFSNPLRVDSIYDSCNITVICHSFLSHKVIYSHPITITHVIRSASTVNDESLKWLNRFLNILVDKSLANSPRS